MEQINEFEQNNEALLLLIEEWEQKLSNLDENFVSIRHSIDEWTVKEIVGHLIDSASNNTHRIIHLQYQSSPFAYPDYANLGNNDRWVAIQNYQNENWKDLVQLWKYINLHIVHVIRNVNPDKLDNEWLNVLGERVSLRTMIADYLRHFRLHIDEINDAIRRG